MPSPRPEDYRLERLCTAGWQLIEFGTHCEMHAAYRALTRQLELTKVVFRVVRPDGKTDVETAP
jgi:hypothetical protein